MVQQLYHLHSEGMRIQSLPFSFYLEFVSRINPLDKTALEGLYRSG